MKHRILFLKFIVTIAIAGSTYSAEESLFDFSSYYSYSSSSSQLDSKSLESEAESTQSVSAPSHHPTMRLSIETNIDYEHLMFSYLKGVESIIFLHLHMERK